MNFLKVWAMFIKHFNFHSVLGKGINIWIQDLEGKLELSYYLLMSLVAKSCNFISKLETLVLHVIILSVSATVIKITEARTANSMGVAPFSYAFTIPQYKKNPNSYVWWNRRAVEVCENLKICSLLLKWNGLQLFQAWLKYRKKKNYLFLVS